VFIWVHRALILCLLASALGACSRLLFYPSARHVLSPNELGLTFQDIYLRTRDEVGLHGWFLSTPGDARGTVLLLHGNAENISTHIRSVSWLPQEGYQVLLLDYRGYGTSIGRPSLPKVFEDIDAAFRWLIEQPRVSERPIFIVGQSLGAALAAYYVGEHAQARARIRGLVLDAPFASYRDLIKEKLASLWLTWPLHSLLPWLISERYSPIRNIHEISPIPILIFASKEDVIVPLAHSLSLFSAAREPKTLRLYRGPHISTFARRENRELVLTFFHTHKGSNTAGATAKGYKAHQK
jgi:Dipeptidyl aminopeptidases/acylaminoacyl-peptidases